MFNSVFYFILNMSITAGLIILLLLVIRSAFGRWIPKTYIHSLWGIVLLRLLVPVSIPGRFSLMNLVSRYAIKTVVLPKSSPVTPNVSMMNIVQGASSYFPIEYKSRAIERAFQSLGTVWAIGAALFVILSTLMYILSTARLKRTVPVRENALLKRCMDRLNIQKDVRLYESGVVSSPVVLGIIKPCIIVPEDTQEKELEFALLHELCHIKRCDNLWKIIALYAVCIHWFNPLAWLLLFILGQDVEFACDEKVLKAIPDEDKKPYAKALALFAQKQQISLTSFADRAVRRRILNIVSFKRMPLFMAAAAALMCVVLAAVLLANPLM